MADFVHLHVHTDYSMLDGACGVEDLVAQAAGFKMPAVAFTDHGNMCAAVEFHQACTEQGLNPIIGCEFYVAPGSHRDRDSRDPHAQGFHLILLAENYEGYQNLCRLNSAAWIDGFYYKPRIDKELLGRHRAGLICLSACIAGEIPALVIENSEKKARQAFDRYLDIFGPDHFFLELQDHGMEEEAKANRFLLELAAKCRIPVVATNDAHYLKKEHAAAHEVLLCIGTQTTLADPKRLRFSGAEFYLKSAAEMSALFAQQPEAIRNTLAIAERCRAGLKLNSPGESHYPVFQPPPGSTREQFIRRLCLAGLQERYGIDGTRAELAPADREKMNRLDLELGIIEKTGFTSYFLVVYDFLHYGRQKGIPIGPGRGSGAGSLVAYLLHITDIDPLAYGLLFERFLNPDRVSPPDFDIDLCERRRQEVITYVRDKYGAASVAQIGTFGTLKAKAVIKDVTRVLGRPFADGNLLTKLIPADPKMTLAKAIDESEELRGLIDKEPWVRDVVTYSQVLEGLNRNLSIHAAGVIIGDQPLQDLVPLARGAEDEVITQYPAPHCESLGLLKMDFLGLKTLTIIQDTVELLAKTRGLTLDWEEVPLADRKTFDLLNRGDTVAVFQLESGGFQDVCRKMGVQRIEDISALLAIYRPGPMQFIPEYCDRKFGRMAIEYDHPAMKSILQETYGIMLYQEQVMQVVQKVAGFSLGQADILRRAMGKKKVTEMEQQHAKFVAGCEQNGVRHDTAEAIWEKIVKFAGYGFNKSHSTAYAVLSYRTGYLKANFPVEFMAAVLTSELGNAENLAFFLQECRRMGIAVKPPEVSISGRTFTVDQETIRFGLAAIKGVGEAAADVITQARAAGPFKNLTDFCERTGGKVNRRVLECLCKAGAFDGFGLRRAQIFAMLDETLTRAQQNAADRSRGQGSLFDFAGSDEPVALGEPAVPDMPEWPDRELLAAEKELLGVYVSGHPLRGCEELLGTYQTAGIDRLGELPTDQPVRLGGILAGVDVKRTKKDQRRWAVVSLEGLNGTVECLFFPEAFEAAGAALAQDAVVFVEGMINNREDGLKITADKVIPLAAASEQLTAELHIRIPEPLADETRLQAFLALCRSHTGSTPVVLCLLCAGGDMAFLKPEAIAVRNTPAFRQGVIGLFGREGLAAKAQKPEPRQRPNRGAWGGGRNGNGHGDDG